VTASSPTLTARFPDDFLWGAATSAYQVEGSPLADGAGPSNWHRFSHTPGKVRDGNTGDVACDHYRRYPEDVGIMRDLGLTAYRFSLSWSRLLPEGRGVANPRGLDFYSRLIDLLLASGIQPLITLYHWDLPAALDDLGGWTNPDCVHWFADYAALAFRAFGDRVSSWATLNEPWVVVDAGYVHGVHPPGLESLPEAAAASHHLLCAHGAAVSRYRDFGRGRIGLVVNLEPKHPASEKPEDRAATARAEAYMNRQFLDPVLKGRCPDELTAVFGEAWKDGCLRDLDLIRQPIDFLGINYYTRSVVRNDPAAIPTQSRAVFQVGSEHTETGWEVYPDGLYEILCWVRERYGEIPLYVTENGAALADPAPDPGGVVEDPRRVEYYRRHLEAAHRAIGKGVDLRGYFAWSLLDNFEWQHGYSKRFGIVQVDFTTQRRTLKRSALFYREVIRTRGAALSAGAGRA